MIAAVLALVIVWLTTSPASAQAGGAAAQTRAGAQTGALPRMADGKPDFSGIWQVMNSAASNLQDHPAEKGIPGGQSVVEGEIPYLASALAKKNENYRNRLTADSVAKCYAPGVPRITYMPFPFHILQTPTYMAFLYEYDHWVRHVYINSKHPAGPIEWWMGDSRAQWDGDTLVVDVTYFNDETWFDHAGNYHSTALHLVERYSFIDRDHLNYEVTVEDSKVFSRPWKMSMPIYRRLEKNIQVLDYECHSFE